MIPIKRFSPKPSRGQVLLFIDFSEVKSKSFRESLQVLEDLGYSYTLGFSENPDGTANLYAILKNEELTEGMPQDYLADEWEKLVEAFLPDSMAVRSPRSLPKQVAT